MDRVRIDDYSGQTLDRVRNGDCCGQALGMVRTGDCFGQRTGDWHGRALDRELMIGVGGLWTENW